VESDGDGDGFRRRYTWRRFASRRSHDAPRLPADYHGVYPNTRKLPRCYCC